MKLVPPPRSGHVLLPASSGSVAGQQHRPAARIDFLGPGRLDERLGDDHFAGDAIDRVEEAVAVGEHHDLARLSADRQLAEHRHLRRIPVVHVVRRELVVPAPLAGVGVERDERRGVEVVALARAAVVIGTGIAGAEEDQVLLGIVGPGDPDRSAAAQVGVALRPRPRAGIAGPRDRVEAPGALAGVHVVCVDEPADAVLGAGDADNDLILDDERRDGGGIAQLVVRELDVEDRRPGFHVERDEVRVERRHEQAIAEHREAAIHGAATELQILREVAAIAPDGAAGSRVDRPGIVVEAGDVQHAVEHERRGLKTSELAGLERPLRGQAIDVVRRDLRERAVTLAVVGAASRTAIASDLSDRRADRGS